MRKIVFKKCENCGGTGKISILSQCRSYTDDKVPFYEIMIKCSCGNLVKVSGISGDTHEDVLKAAINLWNE